MSCSSEVKCEGIEQCVYACTADCGVENHWDGHFAMTDPNPVTSFLIQHLRHCYSWRQDT